MSKINDYGVSPVVGVMLMLIVVIIIAVVVSAFAGGAVSGVNKVPQATITGKFSLSNGLEIDHAGGDGLATAATVFTISDGPMFGQNLGQKTSQVIPMSLITDINGNPLNSGYANVSAFLPGASLFVSSTNSACQYLQPSVYSADPLQELCIDNSANVGKTFSLIVSDNHGNMISKSDVTISP
jgi:FlaG/FlaF family flagellin (archaellin)